MNGRLEGPREVATEVSGQLAERRATETLRRDWESGSGTLWGRPRGKTRAWAGRGRGHASGRAGCRLEGDEWEESRVGGTYLGREGRRGGGLT